MTIKEYAQEIAQELKGSLIGCSIEVVEVVKNNDHLLTGLQIRENGADIAPTIYVNKAYEEKLDVEEAAKSLLSFYFETKVDGEADMTYVQDFENIKESLGVKLLNFEQNKELLRRNHLVYKRVADLVAIPYFVIDMPSMGSGSVSVNTNLLDTWEITEEELWAAVEVSPHFRKEKVIPLSSFIAKMTGMPELDDVPDELENIVVLSNTFGTLGASQILRTEVLDELCEKCGSQELFIIPSSIHETIIFPTDMPGSSEYRGIISEVNATLLPPEEVLSNNLYLYDSKEKTISVA